MTHKNLENTLPIQGRRGSPDTSKETRDRRERIHSVDRGTGLYGGHWFYYRGRSEGVIRGLAYRSTERLERRTWRRLAVESGLDRFAQRAEGAQEVESSL